MEDGSPAELRAALDAGHAPVERHLCLALSRERRALSLMLLERGALNGGTRAPRPKRSPLHVAARGGELEAAELALLLGAGLDAVRSDGSTSLFEAAGRRDGQALLSLLIEHGADVRAQDLLGRTALHEAALSSRPEAVRLLLERGADVDALAVARAPGAHSFHSGTALHFAARHEGSEEAQRGCIRALLEAGADALAVNGQGLMPIHVPPHGHRSPRPVEALLDLRPDLLEARDVRGWTPLHHALHMNAPRIVEVLLARGADVEAEIPSTKKRPLHVAAESGHCVKMLLDAGADTRSLLKNGRTPLMIAADKKKASAVHALLDAGAALDTVDADGLSALLFAALRDRERVVRPLMEAGASPDVPVTGAKKVAGRQLRVGDTARRVAKPRMRALIESIEASRAAAARGEG